MSLPRHLFTPAFRHQNLGRFFGAIVGIMVFISSFAMAAEAVMLTAGYNWGRAMETRLTVELPAVGDEASMSQADRVKEAVSVLRALPGVGSVTPLSDDDVGRLLEPWFNAPDLLKAMPLPALIDVERKSGVALDAAGLRDALKDVVKGARVSDHGEWTQDVRRLLRGLTLLGGMTIALTVFALVMTVNLICRTVIATEHETISLLHLMGAKDIDIARHFQTQAQRIVAPASGLGFFAAMAVVGALVYSTRHIADLSVLEWGHWAGVCMASLLVPICATALAAFVARLSVMRSIKDFP